ncbi:MAG: DUF2079 domain-containing protein [Flavobacteriia bacterium]|nr:DUF2079 domain-containing protein [Flavobacteriia bacterium]
MNFLKQNKVLLIIAIIFGTIFSLISLVNHYNFRTYALDLGLFNNALYDYIHFQFNDSGVFKEVYENLLADHFDMYLLLFSPFSLLFGTYTLLIIQILALLFGGIGVYFCFVKNKKVAIFASLYFFLFFGVYGALSFDYHSNVVAASLVPWLFYSIQNKKLLTASILLLALVISKENISFWIAFVCIGLSIEYRNVKNLRNYLILSALFCAVYFFTITSFVMPSLSSDGVYPHFDYSYLGNNFSEAFKKLIFNPIESIKVMFINHNKNELGDFVKAEAILTLLFSGILFLIKKPQYLLMLLPIFFQKFFHDNSSIWSIGGQYNIEFAPIFAIGIFKVIQEFKSDKWVKILSFIVLFFTAVSTYRTMDKTICHTNKENYRFYKQSHYSRNFNVKNVHKQISNLPKSAVLSVQSPLLPHLALRESIYQFPIIKNAEYVVYVENENTYPLSGDDFHSKILELKQSGEWEEKYNKELIILKKVKR